MRGTIEAGGEAITFGLLSKGSGAAKKATVQRGSNHLGTQRGQVRVLPEVLPEKQVLKPYRMLSALVQKQ